MKHTSRNLYRKRMFHVPCSMFYEKAFTLIELLLVIAIISIISTVGLMNFASFRQDQDLKLTTSEIIGLLRDAQNRSITQDKSSSWSVNFRNNTGTLPPGVKYIYDLVSNGAIVEQSYYLPSSIQFEMPTNGNNTVVQFEKITGRVLTPGNIKISIISNSEASSTIYFDANGNIRY